MAEKQAVGGALHDDDAPQETSVTQKADACGGGGDTMVFVERPEPYQSASNHPSRIPGYERRSCTYTRQIDFGGPGRR